VGTVTEHPGGADVRREVAREEILGLWDDRLDTLEEYDADDIAIFGQVMAELLRGFVEQNPNDRNAALVEGRCDAMKIPQLGFKRREVALDS
jgi:hypothetical protein